MATDQTAGDRFMEQVREQTRRFGRKAPKRIISVRILARRLEISPNALSKYIRREQVQPDYESDSGLFFNPERLPQLKQAIADNRQSNWRHCAA
jgi:hypothetical protein